MSRIIFVFVILFSLSLLLSQEAIAPSIGNGTSENPYQIFTLENLYWLSQNTGAWGSTYIQMDDIDASPTANWFPNDSDGYYGWVPIGSSLGDFTGVYNGNGYTISKLMINRPGVDYIGLFGRVRNPQQQDWRLTISNLGLIDVDITGGNKTGSLIGFIRGWYSGSSSQPMMHRPLIEGCYSTGSVSGNQYTGGLLGELDKTFIRKSYSSCSVNGGWRVGGFAGAITWYSASWDCYSVGEVDGTQDVGGFTGFINDYVSLFYCYSSGYVHNGVNIGGFVGMRSGGSSTNCYWDTQTSGRSSSIVGIPKTTTEMLTRGIYGLNWDFESENPTWWMEEGQTRPILTHTGSDRVFTAQQLQLIRISPSSSYTLMGDIDLCCIQYPSDVWATSEAGDRGWLPIGTVDTPFTGSFAGDNFTISNLFVNRPETDYQSLFGKCSGADIENLTLSEGYVKGQSYTGGVASSLEDETAMINCSYQGTVNGTWTFIGGLAGNVNNSNVEYCFSIGDVLGGSWVGGLLGNTLNNASIENCYSRSFVSGNGRIGGFVGGSYNDQILNSYSTGLVNGSSAVGGFIGEKTSGIASNCFWDLLTSVQEYSSGGEGVQGKTTIELTTQDTFINAGWNFSTIWNLNTNNNDSYPYLIWDELPVAPATPNNIIISYNEDNIHITWDSVPESTSYKIISSSTLDGIFSEDLEGVFDDNSWTAPLTESKKFYQVIAINE